jgi:hypothetical protein
MKPAYQERVIAELEELKERGIKLFAFMASEAFSALPADEQERMRRQAGIMAQYADVLEERIDHFKAVA